MKTYTIVAGVNGCGKSSLLGILKNEIYTLGKIIDVDKITVSCESIKTVNFSPLVQIIPNGSKSL